MFDELLQTTIIINLLSTMLRLATPLLFAAIGELVDQRAGVMNLGVEGTMLFGAFVGWMVTFSTGQPWFGVVAAMLAGGVVSLLFGFMAITLRLDQAVAGLAMNLFASGLTLFWYRAIFADVADARPTITIMKNIHIPWLSDLPFVGPVLFSQKLLTYVAILMVPLVGFFLARTRLGLALRSVGENPRAVDLRGLSVVRLRYMAVVFGGVMAGLAGAFLTTASSSRFLPNMTQGRGWIAVVIVIGANWKPIRLLIATLVFALMDAIQLQITGIGVEIPYQILLAIPYIAALLIMMSSRSRSLGPASMALPYKKE
jgi:general nucleoside transport system permease protein